MSGAPPDGEGWSRVCASDALAERGDGVRVGIAAPGRPVPAFVLRIDGEPRGWLNQCAHVPVELDWTPGRFLDDTGTVIVCATHGAVYDAADGACVGGPCRGRGLRPVPCREVDGWVEMQATLVPEER
ncbi:MAG TPA: Rieske 2Fe-2S domain-containing protein [Burkholderiaceae bacterium]|nr:Rieske 2Fe-2S domain-containing protein [Burkholderiaceae bacterium]